jgi:predicted PurR-regulated permease PerM
MQYTRNQILVRAFKVLDILVIIVLILVAVIAIYFLWPLLVAIIIMAVGYFIYRWYMKKRRRLA